MKEWYLHLHPAWESFSAKSESENLLHSDRSCNMTKYDQKWRSISMESWTKPIKIFHLDQFWHPCPAVLCAPESIRQYVRVKACACVEGTSATERRNYGWEKKEDEMGARQFSARAQRTQTNATSPLGKDDQRQNWYDDASADGRQTVPCRPNKKSFWLKKCKNRRTNILLVGFHLLKYNEHLGTYVHNVSFPELHIFSVGSNEIYQYDLFQIF